MNFIQTSTIPEEGCLHFGAATLMILSITEMLGLSVVSRGEDVSAGGNDVHALIDNDLHLQETDRGGRHGL